MVDYLTLTLTRFSVHCPQYFEDELGRNPRPINTLMPESLQFGKFSTYFFKPELAQTSSGYKPKITLKIRPNTKTPYQLVMKFSPNKAVYGHNVFELTGDDFETFISATSKLLYECGVDVAKEDLANCDRIGRIDYGLNVPIPRHAPSGTPDVHGFITFLKNLDKGKTYATIPKDYAPGFSLTYANKSQRLIFYDKTEEAAQSENPNAIKPLYKLEASAHSLLRIEHRLLNTTVIKRELEPILGLTYRFTVSQIFSKKAAQAILHKHVNAVMGKGQLEALNIGVTNQKHYLYKTISHDLRLKQINPSWLSYPRDLANHGQSMALAMQRSLYSKTAFERSQRQWQSIFQQTPTPGLVYELGEYLKMKLDKYKPFTPDALTALPTAIDSKTPIAP